MRRIVQVAGTVVVGSGAEALHSRVVASRKSLGSFTGTVVPKARVAGSSDAYENVAYTKESDGSAVAAGTSLADQSMFSVDASGKEVAFEVAGPMGTGIELTTNVLLG